MNTLAVSIKETIQGHEIYGSEGKIKGLMQKTSITGKQSCLIFTRVAQFYFN